MNSDGYIAILFLIGLVFFPFLVYLIYRLFYVVASWEVGFKKYKAPIAVVIGTAIFYLYDIGIVRFSDEFWGILSAILIFGFPVIGAVFASYYYKVTKNK